MPQPPTKLALVLPLRRLLTPELRIVCGFEVVVLGFITSAVRVHESTQLVTERGTARHPIGQLDLGELLVTKTSLAHRSAVTRRIRTSTGSSGSRHVSALGSVAGSL